MSNSPEGSVESNDVRQRFVSKHRETLDHIVADANQGVVYRVPPDDDKIDDSSSSNTTPLIGSPWQQLQQFLQHQKEQKEKQKEYDYEMNITWLETFLPCWRWMKHYKLPTFWADLVAGLSVGMMVVPQSMSYAKLAGLPVEYGLYSALMPVYAYAVFGSSRQLAIGPVAVVSLLVGTQLGKIVDPDENTALYVQLAIQTSFLVGVVYIAMGLLRLGFVTIFLSHAVISGFTTGAAITIGMSQVKYIFGVDIDRSDRLYETLEWLIEALDDFNYKTFLVGMFSIALLMTMKHVGKTYPKMKWIRPLGPLTVAVTGIVLDAIIDFTAHDIKVVGHIPRGLPNFSGDNWFPVAEGANLSDLLILVISVVVVGFMESISIAKQLASKHKYEINASQELLGLGMANFVGGMFQAYPITGSFSRSAVNHDCGALSGVSGIITATVVGFVLLFLTPLFEEIPMAILAAIVISGVIGIMDYDEAIYLWRVHRFDFVVWMVAFWCCMMLGVEIGLAISVGLSLLIVIYESAYPHTRVLGRLPGTTVYRSIKQYPDTELYDGIVVVRIDAPLYFANAQNVRDKIRKYRLMEEAKLTKENGPPLKYLVLDLTPVSHIDSSALHILIDMVDNYRSRNQELVFTNPSPLVMDRFRDSGFLSKIGRDHVFPSVHDAVKWALQEMDTAALSKNGSSTDNEEEIVKHDPETGMLKL